MERSYRSLINFLRQFDIFGVPLQLSIQNKYKLYQSTLGGTITMLIYIASALYSAQIIYQWFTWQIYPQVNIERKPTPQGEQMYLQDSIFTFSFVGDGLRKKNYSRLSQSQQHYLFDYSVEVESLGIAYKQRYRGSGNTCKRTYDYNYLFASVCQNVSNKHETYLSQDPRGTYDTYLYYGLYYCDPQLDTNCVGKDEIIRDADLEWMYWELILYLQDVDLNTGEVYTVEKAYYLQYNNNTNTFYNIQLKITKADVTIDNGFFFSDQKQFTIVKDIGILISNDLNFSANLGPQISMSLEKYRVDINITFPQFTLILSQIISFFQTLVLCGFVINLLNSSQMEDYMNETLLKIYFPQFSEVKYLKNCSGKIKKVFYKDVQLDEATTEKLLLSKEKIGEIVQSRLNIFYLIHDVHQLQIAVGTLKSTKDVRNYGLSFLENNLRSNLNEEDFYQHFNLSKNSYRRSNTMQTYPIMIDLERRGYNQNEIEVFDFEKSIKSSKYQ